MRRLLCFILCQCTNRADGLIGILTVEKLDASRNQLAVFE
jgi:hypothetical protein